MSCVWHSIVLNKLHGSNGRPSVDISSFDNPTHDGWDWNATVTRNARARLFALNVHTKTRKIDIRMKTTLSMSWIGCEFPPGTRKKFETSWLVHPTLMTHNSLALERMTHWNSIELLSSEAFHLNYIAIAPQIVWGKLIHGMATDAWPFPNCPKCVEKPRKIYGDGRILRQRNIHVCILALSPSIFTVTYQWNTYYSRAAIGGLETHSAMCTFSIRPIASPLDFCLCVAHSSVTCT